MFIICEKDVSIRRNDLRLLFGENKEFVERMNSSKQRLQLVWFVKNIDQVYQEFGGKNIALADPLRIHACQMREFAFIDINGYYIRISEGIQES